MFAGFPGLVTQYLSSGLCTITPPHPDTTTSVSHEHTLRKVTAHSFDVLSNSFKARLQHNTVGCRGYAEASFDTIHPS